MSRTARCLCLCVIAPFFTLAILKTILLKIQSNMMEVGDTFLSKILVTSTGTIHLLQAFLLPDSSSKYQTILTPFLVMYGQKTQVYHVESVFYTEPGFSCFCLAVPACNSTLRNLKEL